MDLIKKTFCLIILIIIIYIIYNSNKSENVLNVNEYIEKIDSLQIQLDSINTLRENISQKIDTITITIEKVKDQYEKDNNIIINNTVTEDYLFFSKYIEYNKSRLDSINNS